MAGKRETTWQQLCKLVPLKKAYFVKWYCDNKETREDFDKYSEKYMGGVSKDVADDYILEEDVQQGLKFWTSKQHTKKMLDIYNIQYEKALSGDVQSAKWLQDFGKSDFFEEKGNQLQSAMNKIPLEDLKKQILEEKGDE